MKRNEKHKKPRHQNLFDFGVLVSKNNHRVKTGGTEWGHERELTNIRKHYEQRSKGKNIRDIKAQE